MFEYRRTAQVVLTIALAIATMNADAWFGRTPTATPERKSVTINGREAVDGEVIVRYRPQAGRVQRERAEYQAASDRSEPVGRRGAERLRSRTMGTRELIEALRANPDVDMVEPNYIIRAASTPNDPSFGNLWGLFNSGQTVDGQAGVPGADIGATTAWDVTTGSRANIVAVLDTGIDYTHPDLAPNIFNAPREFTVTMGSLTVICGVNTHGYDAINNTCQPYDTNGHGTHVAGIIGAAGNNNLGVTGVNWNANIMALRVLGTDGTGTTTDAIEAIEFAIKAKAALGVDGNVRVLNASWWGSTFSQALDDEIAAANTADMLFVAAAGAGATNNDSAPFYPASSARTNVVSVAAADNAGHLAVNSNFGPTSVDLGAPGGSTLSTFPNNDYGYLGGTSMAAAHVAGAAALVLAACPGINTSTLKTTLVSTVDADASFSGKTVSGGRLNVNTAIQQCLGNPPTLNVTPTNVVPGGTLTAVVSNGPARTTDWIGFYDLSDNTRIDWKYLNGTQTPPSPGVPGATVQFTAPSTPGTYEMRFFTGNTTVLATSAQIHVANTPTLTISDVSVNEGNSGTSNATFTVTLSPPNTAQTVTVNYATANGTATAGSDYTAASGALNFAPSVTTQTITVPIAGDTTIENDETFSVNLSGAINAVIGDAAAVGTIVSEERPCSNCPVITPQSLSVNPGQTITFTAANGNGNNMAWVALYAAGADDVKNYLQWQFMNGTQTAPSTAINNATLHFTAPTTPGVYNIRWFGDSGYTRIAISQNISDGQVTPTLSINDVNVTEGNTGTTNATFTVTLSPVNSSQTVTVNYATANGTATAGSDYTAASGTLTFAPSAATQTITVPISGDTATEGNETFSVNLTGAVNATIGDGQGAGTIANDDGCASCPTVTPQSLTVNPGQTITFTAANGTGNNMAWVALYPSGAADVKNYLQWQFMNGTQTAPSTAINNATLHFTAPTTPGVYNIRWFGDSGYTRIAISSDIADGQVNPLLSINDVSIAEGNSGTSNATFTVTMSPVNSTQTVTVNYATANGTASAGSDYTAASGTLTFAPSVATQTITVPIAGDTTVESNETFSVNLSAAVNAAISDGVGAGTITNDDVAAPTPALSINDVTVSEGNSGSTNATFTVTLSPANSSQTVTVDYATANGTAAAGSDYTAASGTLTFAPSVTTQTITVAIAGDTAVESNETFSVNLSNAVNATIGDGQGAGTITNDDSSGCSNCPTITPQSLTVNPGATITFTAANGTGNNMAWVALYPSGADDVKNYLQWQFMNGTQTAPSSAINNATLHFTAPSTPGVYNIRWFGDSGYTRIAISQDIADGQVTPTLAVNDVSVAEGNSGTSNATFTVTLSPVNSSQTVTVNYATANGTATAGSDYTAVSGTLTFAPSVATQTITVPIAGDATTEGNETFTVNLSSAANAAIGDGQGAGTITNDDSSGCSNCPAITPQSLSVNPGDTITFTVTNGNGNPSSWVALYAAGADDYRNFLQWEYLNGTQTAPSQGITTATLHFTAPSTPGLYNIRWFGDSGYTRLAVSANINDGQVTPTIRINDVSITEGNSGTTNATFTVTVSPVNTTDTVTVDYTTADGTATAGSDYTFAAGTLTFAPSVATQTITVPILGDTSVENDENFTVNLSGAVSAVIGDATGVGSITSDESATCAGCPAITPQSLTVNRGATMTFTATNGTGNNMAWVGLYVAGADDYRNFLQWQFMNGTQTAPSTAINNTTLQFTAPSTPGTYNIRWFGDSGYTRIAMSATITVQ